MTKAKRNEKWCKKIKWAKVATVEEKEMICENVAKQCRRILLSFLVIEFVFIWLYKNGVFIDKFRDFLYNLERTGGITSENAGSAFLVFTVVFHLYIIPKFMTTLWRKWKLRKAFKALYEAYSNNNMP